MLSRLHWKRRIRIPCTAERSRATSLARQSASQHVPICEHVSDEPVLANPCRQPALQLSPMRHPDRMASRHTLSHWRGLEVAAASLLVLGVGVGVTVFVTRWVPTETDIPARRMSAMDKAELDSSDNKVDSPPADAGLSAAICPAKGCGAPFIARLWLGTSDTEQLRSRHLEFCWGKGNTCIPAVQLEEALRTNVRVPDGSSDRWAYALSVSLQKCSAREGEYSMDLWLKGDPDSRDERSLPLEGEFYSIKLVRKDGTPTLLASGVVHYAKLDRGADCGYCLQFAVNKATCPWGL